MEALYGWHFLREDRRLGYGDGREVKVGEKLTVEGPLEMCNVGLHASPRAVDALKYAPGPIACRVVLSGDVLLGADDNADKACATERTVVAMVDATDILREFARDTLIFRQPYMVTLFERAKLQEHARALRALDMATASWEEIQAVCNVAGDAAWAAARAAARAAAGAATWDAAWAAARAAAGAATWAAARAATWAAAGDAAGAAAWAAARDAAWATLNEKLEARLTAAMGVTL